MSTQATRRTGRSTATAALALLMLLPALATPARAQAVEALSQASAEAQVVLVVPDLAALNQQVAALRQALNLPLPEMDDVLSLFKRQAGMINGVNDQGALLVVIEDLADAIANQTEPTAVLLVPVEDYAAFVGNYAGNAEEAVTSLVMPEGQAGFARSLDGYAVLAESQAAVEGYQPRGDAQPLVNKLGQLGQRYLQEADLAVVVDIEALAPTLLPKIDEGMARARAEMDAQQMQGPQAQMAGPIMDLYTDAMKAIVDSSTGAVWALDVADEGVAVTSALHYKEGSALAQVFPGGEANAAQTLALLPEQPFIVAMAWDLSVIDLAGLFDRALAALPEGEANPMLEMYRDALPLMRDTQTAASAWYAPTQAAMMGTGLLNGLNVYRVEDPQAYLEQYKQYLANINGQSFAVDAAPQPDAAEPGATQPGAQAPQITFNTSYTENALQIDGVEVDQYQMQIAYPPELMQQMGQMAPLMTMMGGGGYTGYLAATEGHVVMTTTPDPQLIRSALEAVKQASGIGSAGTISQLREQALPPNAALEVYLSLQGVAQTANMFAPMVGVQPIEVPQDVPPVAMGVGIEDQSVAYRLYIPNKTVRFIVDTASAVQAQMNGQQPGQQAPPPPPGPRPAPF